MLRRRWVLLWARPAIQNDSLTWSKVGRHDQRLALELFEINGARAIIGRQDFDELSHIVSGLQPVTHEGMVHALQKAGWAIEVPLLGRYGLDAFRDGVAVEVESVEKSSVIDTLHRDFFRFLMLYRMKKITSAVTITRRAGGEVNLRKARDDLEIFGSHYEVPLIVVGV